MQPSFLFKRLLHQSSLLYGLPKNVIKQLQRVQNVAACVVTLSPKFCHITPVLANLHWLPIDLRNGIEFKILSVTYKTLHGLAPTYIKDLLQSCLTARDLRSSKKNLLAVPAFNIYRRRAFSVAAPLLWNSRPQHGMLDHS